MKLIRLTNLEYYSLCRLNENGNGLDISNLATNKDILASVIETCEQFHTNCETCPYWLKNKYNCIWNAHKIIGKDVMAYWDDEIEERIL